jgi:hypothetical protein
VIDTTLFLLKKKTCAKRKLFSLVKLSRENQCNLMVIKRASIFDLLCYHRSRACFGKYLLQYCMGFQSNNMRAFNAMLHSSYTGL